MTTRVAGAFLFVFISSCSPKASPEQPQRTVSQQPPKPEALQPPDPFEGGVEFDVVGERGPIPKLRTVPEPSVQRSRQFQLITLNFRGSLGELLEEVGQQTDLKGTMPAADLERRVEVDAKEWPIARVLNHVGLEAKDGGVLKPYSTPPGTRYVPGLRLSFSTRPWTPEGKRLGWIVETLHRFDLREGRHAPTMNWSIHSIEAKGMPVPFETCDLHSPTLVYVPQPDPGSLSVSVRGVRTWYLDAPVEFEHPKPGDFWTGHGFTVTLRWPVIEVQSGRPLPGSLLKDCLGTGDVSCFLPDGRVGGVYDTMGIGGGGGGGGRYGGRFGEKEVFAWCGCRNRPTKREAEPVPLNNRFEVTTGPHWRPLTGYRSIQLDFRALMSEEFEVKLE